MSQATELEKVKARIRALAAKTIDRGCSEAEALAAAKKVGDLLEVYGLSMSEVELRDEPCIQRRYTPTKARYQAMSGAFLGVIALTQTKGWRSGREHFVFFGLEPDVLMGEYLMGVVEGALKHEEDLFKASAVFRTSRLSPDVQMRGFRYGFADRVCDRLKALAKERRASEEGGQGAERKGCDARTLPGKPATGTALVLVKQKIIDEAFQGLGIKLRSSSGRRRVRDRGAYGEGQVAGGRVGLGRPVGSGGRAPALGGRR